MKEILTLIEKFDESTLSKLKLSQGETKLILQKGPLDSPVQVQYHHPPMHMPHPHAPSAPVHAPGGDFPAAPTKQSGSSQEGMETITAPIVGSFYRSPSPDSPVFVEEGTKVKAGDTLCIIEAMKVMNQLEADFDLEVVSILVENGTMVEYGAPLFEVRRI